MAENSHIEWTTHTFNPWRGCTKVSAGCANCYAEERAKRFKSVVWGPDGTRRMAAEAYWRQPVKWNREAEKAAVRPRVFCASIGDVFEDWTKPMTDAKRAPLATADGKAVTMNDVRARLFRLIDATPNLDWLLLTKRPENIAEMMPAWKGEACESGDCPHWNRNECDPPVRHNVWLGTSVENQDAADKRIPHLLKVPAAVRFLSMEPLLGPVKFAPAWIRSQRGCNGTTGGIHYHDEFCGPRVDWVIAGGESGHGARPCDVAWVRSIVGQCRAAGVPVFVKQLGASPEETTTKTAAELMFPNGVPKGMRIEGVSIESRKGFLRDPKGGDPAEWCEDLRVREFPIPSIQ